MDDSEDVLDLIIIGGGINGAGLARDASGRNLRVGLFEMNDFASGTSSYSSKLIHGGLRYLEQYKFFFVREALKEREILQKIAPDIIKPIRFCIPQLHTTRKSWLIHLGLFIYDHLYTGNSLEKSCACDLTSHPDLHKSIHKGFEFSDCQVDDSRLVILNILDAEKRGAEVRNYCKVTEIKQLANSWEVTIFDKFEKKAFKRKSKTLINASGPWLEINEAQWLKPKKNKKMKLVKGSHIIVHSPLKDNKNYLLQNHDGRIVFVIHYLNDLLLIGTTEVEIDNITEENNRISDHEKKYLINAFNDYFQHSLSLNDIIHHFSGIRPLFDDKKSVKKTTRDCVLFHHKDVELPFISIYGGKITSYRKTAEKTLRLLKKYLPTLSAPWTDSTKISNSNSHSFKKLHECYKGDKKNPGNIFCQLTLMINELLQIEKAKTLNDIIWRRTKSGYFLSDDEKNKLESFIKKIERFKRK